MATNVIRGSTSQWLMTGGFLACIGVVGIVQAGIDVRGGDAPQAFDVFRQTPTQRNLRAYEKDLESQSWFARTLRPVMQYARFRMLRDPGEKAVVGRDGWWFYRPDMQYLMEPCLAQQREEVVSAVVAFRDALAARGARLIVLPMPTKPSVYPDLVSPCGPPDADKGMGHTDRVIKRLRSAGVEVMDLASVFARWRGQDSPDAAIPLYLARDTHWTGRGVEVAGAAVAKRALELGWVQPGSARYDVRPVSVSRHGDIPRMLQVPAIENLYPPEIITCDQVVRTDDGQPYRDDPNARVLVLGDSFLRIYENDEPGAAGFIAHLARELRQPLTSIVNDGGGSTLVRQQLARKPALLAGKTLVIWEFVERDIRFGTEGWEQVALPGPSSRGFTKMER